MIHPEDPRPPQKLPSYITEGKPSESTKRKVLDYVRRLGYPTAITAVAVAKDIQMEQSVVNRALYHMGFQPGPIKGNKVARNWYTPESILAEKEEPATTPADVARQMAERARMAQQAVNELGAGPNSAKAQVEAVVNAPVEEKPVEPEIEVKPKTKIEDLKFEPSDPGLDDVLPPKPDVLTVAVENTQMATDDYKVEEPEPEVEPVDYIDERDSWVVDPKELLGEHLHRMVTDRLAVLGAVGIEYEIRVWRKK